MRKIVAASLVLLAFVAGYVWWSAGVSGPARGGPAADTREAPPAAEDPVDGTTRAASPARVRESVAAAQVEPPATTDAPSVAPASPLTRFRVVSIESGEPIAGGSLYVTGNEPIRAVSLELDGQGEASTDQRLDRCRLRLIHPDWVAEPRMLSDKRDVRIEAWRGAQVHGRVIDASGSPIEGAEVSARIARENMHAYTDEAGRYELRSLFLPRGENSTAKLTALHRDWIDQARTQLVLAAGAQVEASDLVLKRRGGSLKGRLLRSDDGPSRDAHVSVSMEGNSALTWTARTDAEGNFVVTRLEAGAYRIDFPALDIADAMETLVWRVEENAATDAGTFRETPPVEIAGRVVFEDGTPAQGAEIGVGDRRTEADADGRFALSVGSRELGRAYVRWTDADGLSWRVEHPIEVGNLHHRLVLRERGLVLRLLDARTNAPIRGRFSVTWKNAEMGMADAPGVLKVEEPLKAGVELKGNVFAEGYATTEWSFVPNEYDLERKIVLDVALTPLQSE